MENKEIEWRKRVIEILDSVGTNIFYMHAQVIYDKLIQAHKEIYGEKHDEQWPLSKSLLDTYLLVRIFGMVKHTKEIAERGEDVDYANFKFFAKTNPSKE